jgi:hypothetical protein
MRRFAVLVLAALLLAVGLVRALPALPRDVVIGAEAVEVAEVSTATGEQFRTTLYRVEKLLPGDATADLRGVRVAIVVDVNDDGTVVVNGVPAPLGYSTHKILAEVALAQNAAASEHAVPAVGMYAEDVDNDDDDDEVEDQGEAMQVAAPATAATAMTTTVEVTVEVDVSVAERQTPAGRGKVYIIQERIVELDGTRVFETVVRQWTVEVSAHGHKTKYGAAIAQFDGLPPVRVPIDGMDHGAVVGGDEHPPEPHHGDGHGHGHGHGYADAAHETGDLEEDDAPPPPPHHGQCPWTRRAARQMHRFFAAAHEQFDRLPFVLRMVLAFAAGASLGYIVLKILFCATAHRNCKRCSQHGSYDANLQAYALQYTALPADEKDEMKKKLEAEGVAPVTV